VLIAALIIDDVAAAKLARRVVIEPEPSDDAVWQVRTAWPSSRRELALYLGIR